MLKHDFCIKRSRLPSHIQAVSDCEVKRSKVCSAVSLKFCLLAVVVALTFPKVIFPRERSGRSFAGIHLQRWEWSSRSEDTLNRGTQTNSGKLLSARPSILQLSGNNFKEHIGCESHLRPAPSKDPSRLQQMLTFTSRRWLTGIKYGQFHS